MQKISLKRWNLTIPVGAKIISTQDLQTYQSRWFTRNADESLTFYAPSSGDGVKSTANSTYPRSELRETLENGDDREANWGLASAPLHRLSAVLRVDSLAKSQKAIIGQFHGKSDHPPFKLQITGDTVYVQYRPKYNGTELKDPILTGYKLGDEIRYSAEVTRDGKFTVTVNGNTRQYQFDVASYKADKWYAKAGMYSQEKVGGEGYGQATFFELEMYHGEVPAVSTPVVTNPAPVLSPQPSIPVATPPASSSSNANQVREHLSKMEDLLDDLPDALAAKLRVEIKAIRSLL